MRILLVLLLLTFAGFTACDSFKKDRQPPARLTPFKGAPAGIDYCGCYFAASDKARKNDEFLFVSDLDSTAFVFIQGEPVTLKLVRTTRDPGIIDERDYEETYSDGVYSVVLKVKFKEGTTEGFALNEGEITLLLKGTVMDKRDFIGDCGC